MDAFYTSVEERDFPELKGKPIVVGYNSERSVIAAANYEARKFGVYSAMPSIRAVRLCPNLIFCKSRMKVYAEVSASIMSILHRYTDMIEPLSLDEAYLDVSNSKHFNGSATLTARDIRAKIKEELNLTASAGISFNKFLAKTASDMNKPNGQFVIKPGQEEVILFNMDIGKFYGIGKATAKRLNNMGVFKGEDLLKLSKPFLNKEFGKVGLYFYDIVRGVDNREVIPDRIRKSYSAETTFMHDITDEFSIITELYHLEKRLYSDYEKSNTIGFTATIKIRYADFDTESKSLSLRYGLRSFDSFHKTIVSLRKSYLWKNKGVRLLGVGISNLKGNMNNTDDVYKQLRLF